MDKTNIGLDRKEKHCMVVAQLSTVKFDWYSFLQGVVLDCVKFVEQSGIHYQSLQSDTLCLKGRTADKNDLHTDESGHENEVEYDPGSFSVCGDYW